MEGLYSARPSPLISGMVTSFEDGKGFGFVADGGGRELFARPSDIANIDPRVLTVGQRVRFEVTQGRSGPQVVAVRKF